MPRGLSITSYRKKYMQLTALTDEELKEMHNSGKAKREPEFALALNKEIDHRAKKLIEDSRVAVQESAL